jgi:hypothetical protein
MLPAQSTTDDNTTAPSPASAEDGEALLARAHRHAAAAEYDAATAYAALATATFTAQAAIASAPQPIYPGNHKPGMPWCQECSDPRRREIEMDYWTDAEQKRCPRCNLEGLRVKPCRYCGTNLEYRLLEDVLDKRHWVDSHNSQSCPKAPHPLDRSAGEEQPDVWPEPRWNAFLRTWLHADLQPVTAEELNADLAVRRHRPLTTYGDTHRDHLERWLTHRVGTDHDGLTIIKHTDPETGELRWSVEATADTETTDGTE